MLTKIRNAIIKIKEQQPLILNVTNEVTMDFVANGLLSLGASPIMSKARQEAEDLVKLANIVVINLGTLDEEFVALSECVCDLANRLNTPIILDPVGAGASLFRTRASLSLIRNYDIAIIKGNASEIMALSNVSIKSNGVDSSVESEQAIESAKNLSALFDATVVVSGRVDIVVDGDNSHRVPYGSPLMTKVTGTGCLLSAVIGAFHAVETNRVNASVLATTFYGMCGKNAAENVKGPALFKVKFLDELTVMP